VPTLSRGISLNSVPCFRNTLPATQHKAKTNCGLIPKPNKSKAKQNKLKHSMNERERRHTDGQMNGFNNTTHLKQNEQ
jgi:hypothetical protein